jgi:hypothetical protein
MARSSPITDDVDPVPRAFRLLASSLIASGEPAGKVLAARLRRDAEILEGCTMTASEANRSHSRMLSRERRVPRVRGGAREAARRVQRSLLSPDDEYFRIGLIEKGLYFQDSRDSRAVQRMREAGLWDRHPKRMTPAERRRLDAIIQSEKKASANEPAVRSGPTG